MSNINAVARMSVSESYWTYMIMFHRLLEESTNREPWGTARPEWPEWIVARDSEVQNRCEYSHYLNHEPSHATITKNDEPSNTPIAMNDEPSDIIFAMNHHVQPSQWTMNLQMHPLQWITCNHYKERWTINCNHHNESLHATGQSQRLTNHHEDLH